MRRALIFFRNRRPGGSGRTSAPAASAAAYGHQSQAPQTFSQSLLPEPEASPGESLRGGLHLPMPPRHQGFGSYDASSKRMPSFPPRPVSCARELEGSQQQLAMVSKNTSHCWNPYLVDSRCQVNEGAERRFRQLASSVHKVEIVLDSVQSDAIRLKRAMKETLLDSGSMQKKVDLLQNSLEKILKGQNDLKVLHEGSTLQNPDHLCVLNSHTDKLNEISSTLSVWPEQLRADLRQLNGDICGTLTKEMEGVARAIRSINSKTAAMQMPESCSSNDEPQTVANGSPKMDEMPVANKRLMINWTPVGNGRPQMDRKPATKLLPAPFIHSTRAEDLKPNVKKENVKGAQLVGSSYMLRPKQEKASNQKVNTQGPTKKAQISRIIGSNTEGHISSAILKKEPADLKKEASSKEALQLLRWERKKRRGTKILYIDATDLLTDVTGGVERRRQEAEQEGKGVAVPVAAAPAKRARRPNPKYDAAQWAT